jgi:hypothetical protein
VRPVLARCLAVLGPAVIAALLSVGPAEAATSRTAGATPGAAVSVRSSGTATPRPAASTRPGAAPATAPKTLRPAASTLPAAAPATAPKTLRPAASTLPAASDTGTSAQDLLAPAVDGSSGWLALGIGAACCVAVALGVVRAIVRGRHAG